MRQMLKGLEDERETLTRKIGDVDSEIDAGVKKKKIKSEEQKDLEANIEKLDEEVSHGVLNLKDIKVKLMEANDEGEQLEE